MKTSERYETSDLDSPCLVYRTVLHSDHIDRINDRRELRLARKALRSTRRGYRRTGYARSYRTEA